MAVYAVRGARNAVLCGFPWSDVQAYIAGLRAITCKKFPSINAVFSSGWIGCPRASITVYNAGNGPLPGGTAATTQRRPGPVRKEGANNSEETVTGDAPELVALELSVAKLVGEYKLAPVLEEKGFVFPDEPLYDATNTCHAKTRLGSEYPRTVADLHTEVQCAHLTSCTTLPELPSPDYIFYTDGGSTPSSGGPGGFGAISIEMVKARAGKPCVRKFSRAYQCTTNNRMELRGLLCALLNAPPRARIIVYTDSSYTINCVAKWLPAWIRAGKLAGASLEADPRSETTPLNKDLLLRILLAAKDRVICLKHVQGHSGHVFNEAADALTNRGRRGLATHLYADTLYNACTAGSSSKRVFKR